MKSQPTTLRERHSIPRRILKSLKTAEEEIAKGDQAIAELQEKLATATETESFRTQLITNQHNEISSFVTHVDRLEVMIQSLQARILECRRKDCVNTDHIRFLSEQCIILAGLEGPEREELVRNTLQSVSGPNVYSEWMEVLPPDEIDTALLPERQQSPKCGDSQVKTTEVLPLGPPGAPIIGDGE